MRRRAVITTEIIAPYRIPVFNALAARKDVDLHIIFLSETDPNLRQWRIYRKEIKFSYEILSGWRRRLGKYNLLLNSGLADALRSAHPEAILCGGYNYLASWQTAFWAKRNEIPLLLWSESNATDQRRGYSSVELLKKCFVGMCRAFVGAGVSSRNYLRELGAPDDSIFVAPNAVDVQMYAKAAADARSQSQRLRRKHELPERYFLYVGRLVDQKGVFDLLEAYSRLDEPIRAQIGLVLVGDGVARSDLLDRAAKLSKGVVKLCGWIHREEIAEFYGLAEALVFPTHSDPWGFVVNEAMACGLAIIASEVAGCVPDLVRPGENGFSFRRHDLDGLVEAMRILANQPTLANSMGKRSSEVVNTHTPETCADGLARAIEFACKERV